MTRPYTVNGLNQYIGAGGTSFTYDLNGNLKQSISGTTDSYVYDGENRLVSATVGGQAVTLSYDPMGRLWQVSGPSSSTRFLYDGDELVAEYDNAGALLRRYVHGNAIDDPVVWYEGSAVGSTNRRQLFTDRQGSVIAVADASGAIVARNAYDEYGIPKSDQAGQAVYGRFAYTGQIWLPEVGMFHYKARLYSPTLGRFLQVDPVGYDDQINLYAYVFNDPMNMSDPTGEVAVGGAIIGAGLDLGYQTVVEGKSLKEVEWGDVAISAAAGATGFNALKAADKFFKAEQKAVRAERALQKAQSMKGKVGPARQQRLGAQAHRAQQAANAAKKDAAKAAAAAAAVKAGEKAAEKAPAPKAPRTEECPKCSIH